MDVLNDTDKEGIVQAHQYHLEPSGFLYGLQCDCSFFHILSSTMCNTLAMCFN